MAVVKPNIALPHFTTGVPRRKESTRYSVVITVSSVLERHEHRTLTNSNHDASFQKTHTYVCCQFLGIKKEEEYNGPFPEKILFSAEHASSQNDRKLKGNYCVYELTIIGAFKKITDAAKREILNIHGIILDEALNEAMTTIDEVVKKKMKPETLRKARFLDSDSKTVHGYEV